MWVEFVRALNELAASSEPIHFVMAHDETLVLQEHTGQLSIEEGDAERTVNFSIRRPDGTERGGVALRDEDLGDVRWTTSATEPNTLRVVLARGYPVLTLTQTRAHTEPQSKPADIHGA